MTLQTMLDHLAQIRRCSDEMLQAAREERWDDLAELDARRGVLIHAWGEIADAMGQVDDPTPIEDCLQNLIDVNNRIMDLAEEYRNRLADEIADSRQQRQAAVAYGAAAR